MQEGENWKHVYHSLENMNYPYHEKSEQGKTEEVLRNAGNYKKTPNPKHMRT